MKMRKSTFNVYDDPGHAWVKVHKSLLTKMGIADKISSYSYMRGEYAYLEEDCDFSMFALAYRALGGEIKYKFHHTDRYSKIRSYQHYSV